MRTKRITAGVTAHPEPLLSVLVRRFKVISGTARYKATVTGRVFRDGAACSHETRCTHNGRPGCWNETLSADAHQFKPTLAQKLRYLISGRFD